MQFWQMTHPDQVRALKPYEFAAMHAYAVKQSKTKG